MPKVRTTITLDEELLNTVTEISEEEERSVSQQIVYFIKLGVEAHNKEKSGRES